MRMQSKFLLLLLFLEAGCYHATVETGATPSGQVIKKGFASGWVYGLVPPSTVQTASQCPSGVAKVETQLSFVNQLVSFLTLGIYTPMEITVTCAAAKTAEVGPVAEPGLTLSPGAPDSLSQQILTEAAAQSLATGRPVLLRTR